MNFNIYLMNLASEFIPYGARLLSVNNDMSQKEMRVEEEVVVIEYIYKKRFYTMIISNNNGLWDIENIYDSLSSTKNNRFKVTKCIENTEKKYSNDMMKNNEQSNYTNNIAIPIIKINGDVSYKNIKSSYKRSEDTYSDTQIINGEYIIDSAMGDITGNKIPDKIYIVGINKNENEALITGLKMIIEYGGINKKEEINLPIDSGYRPKVNLYTLYGHGYNDIFVSVVTTGVEGINAYYIYSYIDGQLKEVFNYDTFNEKNKFYATFLDNYKVQIISALTKQKYLIDISSNDTEYLNKIYCNKGKLKKPINANVSPVEHIDPVDIGGNHKFELVIFNRITGINNADTLGLIETYLLWKDTELLPIVQYLATFGENL